MSEHQGRATETFEEDPHLKAKVQECLEKELALFGSASAFV
jgi:hypothetical protein